MARERISTTVDADTLARTRAVTGLADAPLLDRALAALLREEMHRHEIAALEQQPYGPDVWLTEGPVTDAAPWEGAVPVDVKAKVRAHRRKKS